MAEPTYTVKDAKATVDISIPPGWKTDIILSFNQKYKQVIAETWGPSPVVENYHRNDKVGETGRSKGFAQKTTQNLNLEFSYTAGMEPSTKLNVLTERQGLDTITYTILSRDKEGSPASTPSSSDMYAKVILVNTNLPPTKTDRKTDIKPHAGEETPQLGNIQAEIVPGLNKAFEYFIFFQIDNLKGFRDTMKSQVIPKISTARAVFDMLKKGFPGSGLSKDSWEYVGCSVGFSSRGLSKLGLTDYLYDEAFHRGQRRDAKDLGDNGKDVGGVFEPDWDAKFLLDIDGVFQITAHNNTKGREFVSQLRSDFAYSMGIKQVLFLSTKFRPMPFTRQEHFGFRDGISKPEFKGYTFDDELPIRFPGSPVVDPGLILMGRKGDIEKDRRPAWAVDGSFFVFRKLKQKVPEFHSFLRENGAKIFPNLTADAAADKLGARIFGRWKSGTPVVLSPEKDDVSISNDDKRINNFQYPSDQSTCPFAAHTQKSYPRNNLPGSNDHLFRRASIPYGGELEADETSETKNDRGLIFLCYQSSIERGFKYTQQRFNNPDFPSANMKSESPGYDAVIGTAPNRYMTGANPEKQSDKLSVALPFIEARGGEYFFLPSISTLNQIASGS